MCLARSEDADWEYWVGREVDLREERWVSTREAVSRPMEDFWKVVANSAAVWGTRLSYPLRIVRANLRVSASVS